MKSAVTLALLVALMGPAVPGWPAYRRQCAPPPPGTATTIPVPPRWCVHLAPWGPRG